MLLDCGGYFVWVPDPGLSMHDMDGKKWIDLFAVCCSTSQSNAQKHKSYCDVLSISCTTTQTQPVLQGSSSFLTNHAATVS